MDLIPYLTPVVQLPAHDQHIVFRGRGNQDGQPALGPMAPDGLSGPGIHDGKQYLPDEFLIQQPAFIRAEIHAEGQPDGFGTLGAHQAQGVARLGGHVGGFPIRQQPGACDNKK